MEEAAIKKYIDYLVRTQNGRGKGESLWQLHQQVLYREVAREYGLTEEQIKQLDESLKEDVRQQA